MTDLLRTFATAADESNLRGELDGAAWRFVLPADGRRIAWRTSGPADARDLAAMRRRADVTVVASDASWPADAEVGVGAPDDAASPPTAPAPPVGIDLEHDRFDRSLELRHVGAELRSVVPRDASAARSTLVDLVGPDGVVARSWKQRLRRRPVITRSTSFGSAWGMPPGPPAWLVAAAADAGHEVADHEWGLWCRGEFGSQKLVMFLLPPGASAPTIAVKITRDRRFNARLRNESEMLRTLSRLEPSAAGGAPGLLFESTVWGSAVSAQTAVTGTDLRDHLRSRPELIEAVTDWMAALAGATRRPAAPDDVHSALDTMVDRYVAAYDVPAEVQRLLRDRVAHLAGAGIDAVVQHGDAGPWNAVLTPDDRVAFLDWEAGEPAGLPLWDLLYFLRSASLTTTSRPPWQSRRRRSRRDLVAGSPVTGSIARHVARYVERTDLPPTAVEPLFHLCWVHRAVKQANRLPVDRRRTGTFHRLVLDAAAGAHRPGLRRIVAPPAPAPSRTERSSS